MSKMGAYQPPEKYKNYLLPTSKPLRSHSVYKEKEWTLQERIYKQLSRVAEFLESLYPKLTTEYSHNVKMVIEKNLGVLIEDLDLMQSVLKKNPDSFNAKKLKINQTHITEMNHACDTLKTVKTYEPEYKKLNKIKHALRELEHLIQPTNFEESLEKTRVKRNTETARVKRNVKKGQVKIKAKAVPANKKKKTPSKKVKPPKKLLKSKKIISTKPPKSKATVHTLKKPVKNVNKSKAKVPAQGKKALKKNANHS